jgi:hypothetical protein
MIVGFGFDTDKPISTSAMVALQNFAAAIFCGFDLRGFFRLSADDLEVSSFNK